MTNQLSNSIFARVMLFLLIPVLAAIVMGAIWGVVDWLRAYGSGIAMFPYFDQTHYQLEPFRRQTAGSIPGYVEDLINWYNLNFRGATRFGSGLGLIAGAFIAMGLFKERASAFRAAAGIIAGAVIGARSVLMLGSGVPLFIVGCITGALIGGTYMFFGAAPGGSTELPKRKVTAL